MPSAEIPQFMRREGLGVEFLRSNKNKGGGKREKQTATNLTQERRTKTGETKTGEKKYKPPSKQQLRHNISRPDGSRKTKGEYRDI